MRWLLYRCAVARTDGGNGLSPLWGTFAGVVPVGLGYQSEECRAYPAHTLCNQPNPAPNRTKRRRQAPRSPVDRFGQAHVAGALHAAASKTETHQRRCASLADGIQWFRARKYEGARIWGLQCLPRTHALQPTAKPALTRSKRGGTSLSLPGQRRRVWAFMPMGEPYAGTSVASTGSATGRPQRRHAHNAARHAACTPIA